MRPTIERAYWSRDFETAKAQKACTKQGQGIATRVTKTALVWMPTEARPRIANRARPSGSLGGTEQSDSRSRRRNSDGFIHDVATPVGSLKAQ